MKKHQHHAAALIALVKQYNICQELLAEVTDKEAAVYQVYRLATVKVFELAYQHLIAAMTSYLSITHSSWRESDAATSSLVRIARAYNLTELSTAEFEDFKQDFRIAQQATDSDAIDLVINNAPRFFEACNYLIDEFRYINAL